MKNNMMFLAVCIVSLTAFTVCNEQPFNSISNSSLRFSYYSRWILGEPMINELQANHQDLKKSVEDFNNTDLKETIAQFEHTVDKFVATVDEIKKKQNEKL